MYLIFTIMIRFFSVLITLFMAMTLYAGGNKVIDKQGLTPKWVRKADKGVRSVGKPQAGFRGRKNAGFEKAKESYFFVAVAEEQTPPYEKDDVKDLAALEAGSQLASSIFTRLSNSVARYKKISDGKRLTVLTRLTELKAKANYSGFLLKKEYWELVERDGKKYYIFYQLYTIGKETVQNILEKVSADAGLPQEASEEVTEDANREIENPEEESN